MKIYKVLLLVGLVATNSFSQPLETKRDKFISDSIMGILKVGVYLTHEDFLNNNVVYESNFRIAKNNGIIYNEFQRLSDVVLVKNNNTGKEEIISNFWGVFDGKRLYVYKKNLLFTVIYYGRYNLCFVERIKTVNKPVSIPDENIPFYNPRDVSKRRILDFKTDELYEYDVEYLKFLMKRNCPYYYRLYKKETNKKRKLNLYLRKINGLS